MATVIRCTTINYVDQEMLQQIMTHIRCSDEDNEIFEDELKIAIKTLKGGKLPEIDNIGAKLLQARRETVTKVYSCLYNRIFRTGRWLEDGTTLIDFPYLKRETLGGDKFTGTIGIQAKFC